jgi:hypothetical protein
MLYLSVQTTVNRHCNNLNHFFTGGGTPAPTQ